MADSASISSTRPALSWACVGGAPCTSRTSGPNSSPVAHATSIPMKRRTATATATWLGLGLGWGLGLGLGLGWGVGLGLGLGLEG
jgi:hypothetical protein